jgi:hypothetical protein
MDRDWGQTGEGIATFVDKLPAVLGDMFGSQTRTPRTLFTDRGPGLYNALTGQVTHAYREAVRANGFRTFTGDDGSWQPSDVADVLLHETVAAWVRKYFQTHPIRNVADLEKNYAAFLVGMSECEAYLNNNYEVENLCRALSKRLKMLRDESRGDRLKY